MQIKRRNLNFHKTTFGAILMICLFTTCRKEKIPDPVSASSILYYNGGTKDKVLSVIKTNDNGFLYIGHTTNFDNTDAFLLKVDSTGKQEWYKTYGGLGYDLFRMAIHTSDGDYVAVGATNSESYDTTSGANVGWAVKVNAKGELLWQNTFSRFLSTNKLTIFHNVIENPTTKGYLFTGSFISPSALVCLVSVDMNGGLLFARAYATGQFQNIPPLNLSTLWHMYGLAIAFGNDPAGNILIGGVSSRSYFVQDNNTYLTHILSVAIQGTPIKNFYRDEVYMHNSGYLDTYKQRNWFNTQPRVKIIKLSDGYLIATDILDTLDYQFKLQLIKTDFSANVGNPIWHKEYPGLNSSILYDVAENKDGSFILTGTSSPNGYADSKFPECFRILKTMLLKVGPEGNVIWKSYQGSSKNANVGMCTKQEPDGGYALAGYTSLDESGYHKMFYLRLNNTGNLIDANK